MKNIINLGREDRSDLFILTGEKLGISPAIVEKDFWVCYMLDYLFHAAQWKNAFVFKGGTSLSKVYHTIERFSEDIDLILNWNLIGFTDEEVWKKRSRTKQEQYGKEMVRAASVFLEEQFVPVVQKELSEQLSKPVELKMDELDKDHCTVNFYYDHVFNDSYLRPEIRLEIGPLAEWTPSHEGMLMSFAAEQYPRVFDNPSTMIRTVDAERTFWEKALILHKTAYSCETKGIPPRYARHYYDVYCLIKAGIKTAAFEQHELLFRDVMFKEKFYYARNARYDLAKPGSFRLVPQDDAARKQLAEDYDKMKSMIYGFAPEISDIFCEIAKLEEEMNMLPEVALIEEAIV